MTDQVSEQAEKFGFIFYRQFELFAAAFEEFSLAAATDASGGASELETKLQIARFKDLTAADSPELETIVSFLAASKIHVYLGAAATFEEIFAHLAFALYARFFEVSNASPAEFEKSCEHFSALALAALKLTGECAG